MVFKTYCKYLLMFISFAVAYDRIVYKYYYSKKTIKSKEKSKHIEINDVIMFSQNMPVLGKSKYSSCILTDSMTKFLNNLSSARYTLDICIYVFTNVDLTKVIMKLKHKRVKIRVIVDADMAYSAGSQILILERVGIEVRWMKSSNLMHHKFCVIDGSTEDENRNPFVMTGSMNWTNQAMCGHFENIIVSSQPELVQKFTNEFERLWKWFVPIGRKETEWKY